MFRDHAYKAHLERQMRGGEEGPPERVGGREEMREEGKREGRKGGKQHVRGWLMDTAPFGKTSLFSSYWDMQGFILMWFVHSLTYLSTAFHTMWYISGDTDPSQPPSWSTSALSSTSVLPLGSASSALRLGEPLPASLRLVLQTIAPITS